MLGNIPPIIVFLFIAVSIVTIIDVATSLIQLKNDRSKILQHTSEINLSSIPPKTCKITTSRDDNDNIALDN